MLEHDALSQVMVIRCGGIRILSLVAVRLGAHGSALALYCRLVFHAPQRKLGIISEFHVDYIIPVVYQTDR